MFDWWTHQEDGVGGFVDDDVNVSYGNVDLKTSLLSFAISTMSSIHRMLADPDDDYNESGASFPTYEVKMNGAENSYPYGDDTNATGYYSNSTEDYYPSISYGYDSSGADGGGGDKYGYYDSPYDAADDMYGYDSAGYGGDKYGGGDYKDAAYDAAKKKVKELEYHYPQRVLYYAVITLYLILIVEAARHSIDHAAHGRPFFKAVLLMVYSELATLGIVEFALFLWKKYGSLDKTMKAKFADVHFALFLTAIFNGLQYALTSIIATWVSNKMWVQTEQLDLGNYVEIREEFQKLNDTIEDHTNLLGKHYRNLVLCLMQPGMRRRYESLRVQVRFHELRLHLVESNNLPVTLKVSEYLKRAELGILIGLLHISATSWIILIAGFNVLYFIMGIIGYTTEPYQHLMPHLLKAIFWIFNILFIIISRAMYWKMHSVFQTILKLHINSNESNCEKGIERQRQLFWLGSPSLIVSLVQLMNFGYAVLFSIIIIYWYDIDTSNIKAGWYLFSTMICYGWFLYNLSYLLPEYTLCTSLGYLTCQKALQETVAMHRLDEAERKQRLRMVEDAIVDDLTIVQATDADTVGTASTRMSLSRTGSKKDMRRPSLGRSSSIADLVKMDTKCLRDQLTEEDLQEKGPHRRGSLKKTKSSSSGVSAMRDSEGNEINTKESEGHRSHLLKSLSSSSLGRGWDKLTHGHGGSQRTLNADDVDSADGTGELTRRNSTKGSLASDSNNDENRTASEWEKEREERRKARQLRLHKAQSAAAEQKSFEGYSASGDLIDLSSAAGAVLANDDHHGSRDDDDTISVVSLGNLSDIDCVQAEDMGMILKSNDVVERTEKEPLLTRFIKSMRSYFQGSSYVLISHVLGTSVIFFLVGHRFETMTQLGEYNVTGTIFFFKFELFILLCFMFADTLQLILFPLKKYKTEEERRLVVAASIDIFIVFVTLILFLVAEGERCCKDDSDDYPNRFLAGAKDVKKSEVVTDDDCKCQQFGSRTYGGIGMIEPFTSLVVLRIFRFRLAKILVPLIFKHEEELDDNEIGENLKPHKLAGHGHGDHGHDDHGDGHENSGTALELWERAISAHPEIVKQHGQFSSEMLQAMLGLKIHIDTTMNQETKKNSFESHIKLSGKRFEKISPLAQGIVVAGKIGKPVKQMTNPHNRKAGNDTGLVEFEVDTEQMEKEENTEYTFVAPFARLVRRVRRCDRKQLPLFKDWISVDVVMTQFEIVYFEAFDHDVDNVDQATKDHVEACKAALQATKGGKNLRLCDFARGRRVVGHLDLHDITAIHVMKDVTPCSDKNFLKKFSAVFEMGDDLNIEYWADQGKDTETKLKYSRNVRWFIMEEDRLKITTASGTIIFRFYSDLEYFETEKQSDANETIANDVAFQWAETITRICGRDQLHQELPHFGQGGQYELRDYLQAENFHEKDAETERKHIVRGLTGIGKYDFLYGKRKAKYLGGTAAKQAATTQAIDYGGEYKGPQSQLKADDDSL